VGVHSQLASAWPLAALHGVTGGWDELVLLVAGIVVAVAVVHLSRREAKEREGPPEEHDRAAPGDRSEPG